MYFPPVWLLFLGMPLLPSAENAGIRMTIESSMRGNANQRTIYLQGDRKRVEFRNSFGQKQADGSLRQIYGPRMAAITRCDLGQTFELNLDTSEYTSGPYPATPLTKEEMEARGLATRVSYLSEKPTLRIEMATTDTGERKEIFGQVARHVITKQTQTPLEGSHTEPQETVTDGWYIDLNQRLSCDRKLPEGKQSAYGYLIAGNGKEPREKPEFVSVGEPERGLALISVTTTKGALMLKDGAKKATDWSTESRVTEFEERPVDPALFEIPAGFKHVDHIERNPPAPAFTSQPQGLWERFRARVAGLF